MHFFQLHARIATCDLPRALDLHSPQPHRELVVVLSAFALCACPFTFRTFRHARATLPSRVASGGMRPLARREFQFGFTVAAHSTFPAFLCSAVLAHPACYVPEMFWCKSIRCLPKAADAHALHGRPCGSFPGDAIPAKMLLVIPVPLGEGELVLPPDESATGA